ncbi:RimK family alpha-L-glutamate ligase [Candidatus Saccharibacteria bacterium]|nr:RimK family alpha-L-glutamate ligase [Candidatus Saccharibacteria bacterium]MBR0403017.1 RimK family alpha-L-glutamate ligase [Candidatus Saccharibacteria bacterium]MBR3323564.1 RimK family alpha-L-glutamate ligase [Candidatus Saccharibacteria bacterium]
MKIAILSNGNANYSTKRLVEEAEARGHEAKVIKYKNCYISLNEKRPDVFYKGKRLEGYDAIIPRIANYMTRYGCAIVRQLEMQGVWTASSSIAITRARDKLRSAQILTKAGVDTPKTLVSRNTADIDDLLDQIGLPVIIKLATSTHGNGVVLADTKKAARSALQAFYLYNEDGTNILLQEYIEESAGSDIRAFVVGSKVVASMKRQSLDDDFRSNLHKGGGATSVKLTEEERKMAIKAAKAMGLHIAGVDLMRSSRGPLVLEVNASPGFGIEKITGRNVAAKMIEYVEHNAGRRGSKDKVGA